MDHPGPGLDGAAEQFRTEVCAWLTAEMASDRTSSVADPTDRTGLTAQFGKYLQAEAGRRGWLGISLPTEIGGGGRPASYAAALAFESAYHDAPLVDTAVVLAGAPVIAFGSAEQQASWLPRMLAGQIDTCIAYTEPDAGNDLASLTTTAVAGQDGGFVLNGRKTLITAAGKADACLTVARTDPEASIRRGISMFLFDMARPGVSVVPRRTMADYDLWDVVFDSAWVPAEALLGELNAGWRQMAYSVEQERTGMYSLGWSQRLFDELRAYCLTPGPGGAPIDDPRVADRLADLWVGLQDGRRASIRLTREEVEGRRSAASASAAKVMLTEYAPRLAQAATELTGPDGSIAGSLFGEPQAGAPAGGRFAYEYLFRFDGPISVGANEIHRGGIAAGLGLSRGGNQALLEQLREDATIRKSIQAVLARESGTTDDDLGYDQDVWAALLRDVWPQVTSGQDVRVVLDEIGRSRCPLPIHSGLVQPVAALSAAGAQTHLAELLAGTRYAIGLHDGAGRPAPQHVSVVAHRAPDGGWRLAGQVRHVSFGVDVERFLLAAKAESGGILLVVVPATAPGLDSQTRLTISADRLTDITLEDVSIPADGVLFYNASAVLDAAVTAGRAAYAAELGGMSAALLELAVQRVATRQAYGAPIGALQAVQQRVADAYLDTVVAHDAAVEAADALAGGDAATIVAGAKLSATAAALRVAAGVHQVCGGWGHLSDSGLHSYTRAIKSAEGQLGTPLHLRSIVANALRHRPWVAR